MRGVDDVAIGLAIRRARKAHGLKAREVADELGVSATALANYEAGRRPLTAVALLRIAAILRVPVGELFGGPVFDERTDGAAATDDSLEVGQRLREAREKRGLSQVELAKRVGCSESLVSRWEAGERPLKTRQLMRVINVLGITLAQLWGAHDWVAELEAPDEWPPGLRDFLCSDFAVSEAPVSPKRVGQLAGMAYHPRWKGTKSVNDWRHAAMMLLLELGENPGVMFPDDTE